VKSSVDVEEEKKNSTLSSRTLLISFPLQKEPPTPQRRDKETGALIILFSSSLFALD